MFNTSIISLQFKETSGLTLTWNNFKKKKSQVLYKKFICDFFSDLFELTEETWKSPLLQIHIHKTSQVWKNSKFNVKLALG